MRYFRIEDSFCEISRWHLKGPETTEGDELDPRLFTAGMRYSGRSPLRIAIRRGTQPLDFTLGSFDMPVVKREVAEMIEALAPMEVQRIPAKVIGDHGWFEVLNVLNLRKAINESKSEIRWWKEEDGIPDKVGKYAGIAKLVLDQQGVECAHIFRLIGWELPLIVCESIKDRLEGMNVSGISFLELQVV